jgi:hypothetical protein
MTHGYALMHPQGLAGSERLARSPPCVATDGTEARTNLVDVGGKPASAEHRSLRRFQACSVRFVICARYAAADLGVIVPASVSRTISDFARLAAWDV